MNDFQQRKEEHEALMLDLKHIAIEAEAKVLKHGPYNHGLLAFIINDETEQRALADPEDIHFYREENRNFNRVPIYPYGKVPKDEIWVLNRRHEVLVYKRPVDKSDIL